MALKQERGSNKTKGLCQLAIDEDLTIFAIDALKQSLSEEIDIYNRFELNLGNVEEVDSAGIQLLLAFRKELMKKNKELKFTALSAPVSQLIKNYGISECFNIEVSA